MARQRKQGKTKEQRTLVVSKRDGSVEDTHGKVIYFSCERFIRDIIEGDCCFVCGAAPKSKEFNDEHIIADWILREFKLHSRKVTLPNGKSVRYGSYTVPCCKDCNSALGATYEKPIQTLLSKGHDAVCRYMDKKGPWLVFAWLGLMFLKTHLKDRTYRLELDARLSDPSKIGDLYDYAALHHVHCLVRAPFTGVALTPNVLGSFLTVATRFGNEIKEDAFDYCDTFSSRTVAIRYHGTAFVAALDDSCGALSLFHKTFMRITGAVFPGQLREIHAHIAFLAANLDGRPRFKSDFSGPEYVIRAVRPKDLRLKDKLNGSLGEFVLASCGPMTEGHPDRALVLQAMREGRWSYLFDAEGKLIVEGYNKRPNP